MDHNETEPTIVSLHTTKSAFYCPHVPQLEWDVHGTISPWIFATFASIISPAAVLLNALIIIAIKKKGELQRLSNILLSSMAITDLLVGGICAPLSAIDGLLLSYQILSPQHICTLYVTTACFTVTLIFCSVVHLTLIAWERYVAIRRWRDYRVIVTKDRLKKLAKTAWILGTVFILSPILISVAFTGQTRFPVPAVSTCCMLALIVYFYFNVYREIRKRKFNQISQVSVEVSMKLEYRVAKTTALVTVALILSFMPAAILSLLGRFFPVLRKMSSWCVGETLMLSNSLVNPLIYCYRDRHFRKAVFEILRIKKPEPKNEGSIARFVERKNVRGSLKERVAIIQEADKNVRLIRSTSSKDLTSYRAHIEPNSTSVRRTRSAPLFLVEGSLGVGPSLPSAIMVHGIKSVRNMVRSEEHDSKLLENVGGIIRFTERNVVRGLRKDRLQITQLKDKNIRLTRSTSNDLTRFFEQAHIEPSTASVKRTMSAPLILLGSSSCVD